MEVVMRETLGMQGIQPGDWIGLDLRGRGRGRGMGIGIRGRTKIMYISITGEGPRGSGLCELYYLTNSPHDQSFPSLESENQSIYVPPPVLSSLS